MIEAFLSRLQQHAEQRLITNPKTPYKERIEAAKEFLRLENIMLERMHKGSAGGIAVCGARTSVMDCILTSFFDTAITHFRETVGPLPCEVCLLALGGYGRAELSPFSDIDIMFLFPNRVRAPELPKLQEELTNTVLYPLWDLQLKVGHSTRTIRETVEEGRNDMETKNAQLESRMITGSRPLYRNFQQAYKNFYRKDNPQDYIQQRLIDQKKRRNKYGGTVFLQEPDIKNGVGGLRDFQNILWMTRIKMGFTSVDDLLSHNYLNPFEHRDFKRAYDFLLQVRNELHIQSSRPTDLLDLEKQLVVARGLGYKQVDDFVCIESFMKDYYKAAQSIYQTSKVLEKRLALDSVKRVSFKAVIQARRYERKKYFDGFILSGGELTAESGNIFVEDPVRLIRVFRHCQQFEARLDFDLSCLIRDSITLIDKNVINSMDANLSFRTILQTTGTVYPILEKMNELGVLGRFLPEFDNLHCLVQHEYYHRYTADIHTLNTIRELDAIFSEPNRQTEKYLRALRETTHPTLLYLMLLLHDIGKGEGISKHAERGEQISVNILERMGVKTDVRERILFIIRNHLEMARFWQRFDVEDQKAINKFAKFIENEENLQYLYVLTFCDARATASNLWNEYKDMLHAQLYFGTLEKFSGKKSDSARLEEEMQMISQAKVEKLLPELPREEIEAHYNLLPERYFLQHTAGEISLHLGMIHQLLGHISNADSVQSLVPVIDWKDDLNLSMSVVSVVTWDRAGLFFKLAGAFSVAGLSIVGSKALSRDDHITIDTFYICEAGGGVVQDKKTKDIFKQHLTDALTKNKDLLPEIVIQAKKLQKPSYLRRSEPKASPIKPSVNVYHEVSLHRTIIEVEAEDQIGLLYKLTKAIYDHGFDITFARISTERRVAVDTFYIERMDKKLTQDTGDLLALRENLNAIVIPAEKNVAQG